MGKARGKEEEEAGRTAGTGSTTVLGIASHSAWIV